MSDENRDVMTQEDERIRRGLAVIYAAPSDPAYWNDLQLRILTRIADSDPKLWWLFMGRWARAGVVAAALALMAAGVASVVTQRAESRLAYQAAFDDRTPLTTYEKVSRTSGISDHEAALRYVLSINEGSGR